MEKIGIFCSASENIDKVYFESARQIGEWMGQKRQNLDIWRCQPRTDGMYRPRRERKRRQGHRSCSRQTGGERQSKHSVRRRNSHRNLSDRKDIITEKSEVLVALPGGVGNAR